MFEVEKSSDGRNWNVIGEVSASNTIASSHTYAFTGRTTNASTTHYRVKQVDINGAFIYTVVRTLMAEGNIPALLLSTV